MQDTDLRCKILLHIYSGTKESRCNFRVEDASALHTIKLYTVAQKQSHWQLSGERCRDLVTHLLHGGIFTYRFIKNLL